MAISLKAARINAGLSQENAAKKFNVSTKTLSQWENQKTFPNIKQLMQIEEVYGVKYSDIIFLPIENG